MKLLPKSLYVLCAVGALTGCGDDAPASSPPATPAPTVPRPGPRNRTRGDGGTGADASLPPLTVTDNSFVESQQVRDPFHSYATEFLTTGPVRQDTRAVMLANYALEDLHLVAVVLGTDSPYAMVIDPTRQGTILRRGMLVGRPEMIHPTGEGQQDYAVHWRVARVLPARVRRGVDGQLHEVPAELVFEREDPFNRVAQVVERSLALVGRDGPSAGGSIPDPALPPGAIPGVGGPAPSYLPPSLGGSAPAGALPSGAGGAATGAAGGRAAAPTTTTTVIVQAPPQQQTVQPMSIPTTPPPVVITGTESPLR